MARRSSSTIRFKQDRTIDTKAEYFIVISIISFMILIISICLISSIINDKDIPLFLLFTSPISSHAISLFAYESGLKPKAKIKKK